MNNTNRFNDLSITKETKLIPGDGLVENDLESDGNKLRDDLINQIAKGDGPEIPQGRRFITLGNECYKSGIESPNDSAFQSGMFNNVQYIMPHKVKKVEIEFHRPTIKSRTLVFLETSEHTLNILDSEGGQK